MSDWGTCTIYGMDREGSRQEKGGANYTIPSLPQQQVYTARFENQPPIQYPLFMRESGEGRWKERTARDNRGDIKKLPPFFRLSFRKILYKLKKHSLRRKEFTKGRGTKRRDEREGGMGVEEGGREEDKYA